MGEMSLVGPRPPISYELECYDIWHRRRLLEAKPGITGLWQVNGRSRTSFDEMVRLDLQYAKTWSLWLGSENPFEDSAGSLLWRGRLLGWRVRSLYDSVWCHWLRILGPECGEKSSQSKWRLKSLKFVIAILKH